MAIKIKIDELSRLPNAFTCDFKDDFPLGSAHDYILSYFDSIRSTRLAEAYRLRLEISHLPKTVPADEHVIDQLLTYLNNLINRIDKSIDKNEYNNLAQPLVNAYLKELDSNNKLVYINKYLNIVLPNYIKVVVKAHVDQNSTIDDSKSNTRGRRKKSESTDRANFRTAILRFQGKEEDKIKPDLYNKLENYFAAYPNGMTHAKANAANFDEKGRKIGTSRELMETALRETGNSGYFEHIRLVMAKYWGWQLPDISQLEDKLMFNFDLTQKIFNDIKVGRSSNLNIEFLLWKHLQAIGYICDREDFKIIKSSTILEEYEVMWKAMVEGAQAAGAIMSYIPTVK